MFLHALLKRPAANDQAEIAPGADALCHEALGYARRLAQLLPSPEARFLEAYWTSESSDVASALAQTRAMWQDYQTRALAVYHAHLLQQTGHSQEVAEFLDAQLARYPNDYELAWQCGTAWALVNVPHRAIEVLELLIGHPSEGVELYINLALAQLHAAVAEPYRAGTAFDLLLEAFRKYPMEQTLPARIMEAGRSSSRMREVHQLLDTVDLSDNPHLRRLTDEQVLAYIPLLTEQARLQQSLFDIGMVPFSFLAQHVSSSVWYGWWERLAMFEQRANAGIQTGASVVVYLPSLVSSAFRIAQMKRRLLLDMTALLTLGASGALPEVLDAFEAGKWKVYLFPDAQHWLEQETSRLQVAQWPLERSRYAALDGLLRGNRVTVTVHPQPTPSAAPPDETRLQTFGRQAFDIAEAEASQGYYLDDTIEPEAAELLPQNLLRTSQDLLEHLVSRGVVLPADVQRIRLAQPELFVESRPCAPIDVGRPVVVSEATLLGLQETGLLSPWVSGGVGWPPLAVGPCAYADINRANTEARINREALEQCNAVRSAVKAALRAGKLHACPPVPRLNLKIGNLLDLWKPALDVLAVASRHELAVCADDLFFHHILDKQGLLGEEAGLRPMEKQVRQRFPNVTILGTAGLLERLSSEQHLSAERASDFQWKMFRQGYRGSSLRGTLRWLMFNVPLRSEFPIPYQYLVDALSQAGTWLPPGEGTVRKGLFLRTAVMMIVQDLLLELWSSPANVAAAQRVCLADALLRCFEGNATSDWSVHHNAFWTLLGTQLAVVKTAPHPPRRGIRMVGPGDYGAGARGDAFRDRPDDRGQRPELTGPRTGRPDRRP